MIGESQFPWMQLEVGLILQVADVVTTHVMSQQGDRTTSGQFRDVCSIAATSLSIARLHQALQMTDGVQHDVAVPAGCRHRASVVMKRC